MSFLIALFYKGCSAYFRRSMLNTKSHIYLPKVYLQVVKLPFKVMSDAQYTSVVTDSHDMVSK